MPPSQNPPRDGFGVDLRPSAWAVALGVMLVFLPSVRCGFVNWDDDRYVYDNPVVMGGISAAAVLRAFSEPVFFNWAPLTIISYQIDASLFGLQPWGFHLTSVLIHAVSSGLLYLALTRLTGARSRSLVATILFAVHPLRVESVTWVSDRKDVLCGLFLVLALLAYEWYCRAPGWRRFSAVAGAMLGGLMSKSTMVTLPVLLLVLDIWPLGRLRLPGIGPLTRCDGRDGLYPQRSAAQLMVEKLPLALLSVLFTAVTVRLLAMPIAAVSERSLFASRVPNALYAVVWYLRSTLWPVGLCTSYGHAGDRIAGPTAILCLAAIVCLIAGACRFGRQRPYLACGLGWFLIAIFPLLGLVQLTEAGYADRYTYVPHVGLMVAVVWGASDLGAALRLSPRLVVGIVAAAVAMLVGLTERQILTWRSSETLWQNVLDVEPDNWMAHVKQGHLLHEQGRDVEAERHFLQAKQGTGAATFVLRSLASFYFDLGRFAKAAECRDLVVQFDPDNDDTRRLVAAMRTGPPRAVDPAALAASSRGLAAARAGRFADALSEFRAATAVDPKWADAHANAGLALASMGRSDEALAALRRAVELNPHHADFRVNLANQLSRARQWDAAAGEAAAAVAIDPFDAEAVRLERRCRMEMAAPR